LSRSVTGQKNWEGENAPDGTAIAYLLNSDAGDSVHIAIADAVTGEVFRDLSGPGSAGLHRVHWNLRGNPPEDDDEQGGGGRQRQGPMADAGVYRVTLTLGGRTYTQTVAVEEDRWM